MPPCLPHCATETGWRLNALECPVLTLWQSLPVKTSPVIPIRRQKLPGAWSERLRLANGRVLWLRRIRPEDAGPIDSAFSLLSHEEIRLRYLHLIKSLSPDYLHRLTHPEKGREFVLVAAEPMPPGQALVGAVARLSIDTERCEAEFAILVSHFVAGFGLGRLLMARLIGYARRRKLKRIHGDVLEENTAMLALAKELGFELIHVPDSGGVARVELDLTQPPKARAALLKSDRRDLDHLFEDLDK